MSDSTPSAPLVRLATSADLPLLLELMQGYYRDDGLVFSDVQAAAMSRLLAEPQWGRVYVLEVEGQPAGYLALCIGFSLELGGNDAFIDEVFVSPPYRGKGYGRRLLNAAAEDGRSIRALHLEVDRNNVAAQRLYTELGYRKRERYFLMTKWL